MKRTLWPTQEELEAERLARWNNLPKKIKLQFIEDWREFILKILISSSKEARKKLSLKLWRKLK